MSRNRAQRSRAYQDGVLEADGGICNRHKYVHDIDLLAAYNQGKVAHTAYLKEQAAAFDHPLREISRRADALSSAGESSEARELADLIRDMADYLVNKESM